MRKIRLLFYITGISTGGAHQSAIAWFELLRASGRFDVTVLVGLDGWFADQLRRRGIPFEIVPLPVGLGAIKHGTWKNRWVTALRVLSTGPALLSAWARVAFRRVDGVVLTGGRDFIMTFPLVLRLRRRAVTIPQSTDWASIPTCRLMCRLVARVYAISQSVADSITDMGIDPAKVRVLPLIYTRDRAAEFPERRVLRQQLGLPDDGPLIGMVGLVRPNKGQLEAVRILARVRRAVPTARLVIAGAAMADQPVALAYQESVRAEIRELGLESAVTMLGWRDDVPAIMRSLDVLLVPSHDREGVPRVILEGLESGLPLVATDMPQFREVLAREGAGRLAPIDDLDAWTREVLAVIADPAVNREEAARARAVWQRAYSEDAVRPVLLRAFAEVGGASLEPEGRP